MRSSRCATATIESCAAHEGPLRRRSACGGRSTVIASSGRAILDGQTVHIPDVDRRSTPREFATLARAFGTARLQRRTRRADAARGRGDRRHRPAQARARRLHAAADRAARDLRRPGRDRHRERAAVHRTARIAGIPDGDQRRAQGHEPLDLRPRAGAADRRSRPRRGCCGAQMAGMFQLEDGAFRWKAGHALDPRYQEHEKATPLYPGEDTLVGRVALRGTPVPELDALADPAYGPKEIAEIGQVRSMLGVPMTARRQAVRRHGPGAHPRRGLHRQAGRTGDGVRRPGGDRHRERAPVQRDPGEEPPARDREPAQVAVPRQHEPRAAHAAQRHHRLHRDDGRRPLRRRRRRRRRACWSGSRATAATCSA